VVCFAADVGQGNEMDGLEAKAIASGASQLVVHDLREELAEDYIFRMLRAGAIYERKYLLGTSIARPLIAKHQVEVAHEVGADALSHGATGKGNDQVRFELAYTALDPRLKVIAPWRHRIRQGAQRAGQGHVEIHLQPGRQPVASFPRRRPARRPLAGTRRVDVPDFVRARKRSG
jgi:argininosuccinate synthase